MNKILEKSFNQGHFEVFDNRPDHLDLIHVHQTHSKNIILEKNYINSEEKADGIIFSLEFLRDTKKVLAIKTADCLPILYLSKTHVALVHAGWKGIELKIHIHPEILLMQPTEVFIGPCISGESFKVTREFQDYFPKSKNFSQENNHLTFDLVQEVCDDLSHHIADIKMTQSGVCTFKNNQYNSYRLNKTNKRNWNIFKARGLNE